MTESDKAKRRTFLPPLTLDHILLTELINAPSPVTPQHSRSCFNTPKGLPKPPEITKKRVAIKELVNDDAVSEPTLKRQKFLEDEPLTPTAAEQLLPTQESFPANNAQTSVGAGLQTLATIATSSTSSTGSEGEENKENEPQHAENNARAGSRKHFMDQNNINNFNNLHNKASQPRNTSPSSFAVPPLPSSQTRKDRKYVCHICHFRFHQAGGLRNHTRAVHLKEKPYGCAWPGCLRFGERGFAARGDLTRHVSSVHKGERNFRCDRCTMRFARRSVLVRHSRNIHGIGKR